MNFLPLQAEERVTSVLAVRKEEWDGDWGLMMVTKNGLAKKSDASAFKDVRRSGLIALKLKPDDSLIAARFVGKDDEVSLVTRKGQSIRFKESDVREMGRTAAGVAAMKIGKGDIIVSAEVLSKGVKDREVLVVTENGFGKATPAKEYKIQKRAGSGIKTVKVTEKTGEVVAGLIISKEEREEGELVIMSNKGQVIKLPLKQVPVLGRDTQGVRVMKMRAGDKIASVVFV
jgi:DNA gyrase subunit A